MDLELNGKVALVTGSSTGIGNAIAKKLSGAGCDVVINGRNKKSLTFAASDIPGAFIAQGDVSQPDEAKKVITETLSKMGKIDILVCNVGSGSSVLPGNESYDEWQRVFAINFWSTTNTVEAAISALSKTQGVIVCVSSICGSEVIDGAPITYSAAKAALNAYVRGISRPLSKHNVRINAIAPGNIYFPGSNWEKKIEDNPEEIKKMIESTVTMKRFGTAEEIADAALFLCSDHSSFMTGSCLTVDGGQRKGIF